MCSCRKQLRSAVRWTNVLVGVLGLALVCFGIYLCTALSESEAVLYVLALLLGIIDMTMGFLAASFGYKSVRFLRAYALVVGLADIAQVVMLVLFTVPAAQEATFNAVHLTGAPREKLKQYSTAVGALFAVVVALQLLALAFSLLRCSSLDEHYDSDTEESGLLRAYQAGGVRATRLSQPTGTSLGLGGLLDDYDAPPQQQRSKKQQQQAPAVEPAREQQPARFTYSNLYDKYTSRR